MEFLILKYAKGTSLLLFQNRKTRSGVYGYGLKTGKKRDYVTVILK